MCNSHELMNQPELHIFTFTIEAESKDHLERITSKIFELVERENASPFYTKENPFNLRKSQGELDTLPFGEYEGTDIASLETDHTSTNKMEIES